jgi:mRNA-degrading endonuclease RelE of RelBE toxin-antitoxin system
MRFRLRLTDSAIEDLDHFRKKERRTIAKAIALFLTYDADVETKRRKALRPNKIAPWELRVEDYRVFYDFAEEDEVKIIAIGRKERNDVYIRGKKVEL